MSKQIPLLDPILAQYGVSIEIPRSLRGYSKAGYRHRWRRQFFWVDHFCSYCGEWLPSKLTEDHVVPRSRGGANTLENIVQACHRCNGEKDDKTLLMFLWERAA